MTSLPDDWNDIWTTPETQQQDTGGTAVKVEIINDVEPLGEQFGIDPKKTVPDALYDAFFGQPQPSDTEITAAGGDPKNVPAMQTYALLDAAKVTHLSEMLAASDLEHRCLFKGDAYDDLKDAAPWLVRLEEGNDFTRNLFTKGDAPWHLWGAEAGIYIRSRASLEELWKHFRKFTRIQDENGKWYYWRFWEPEMIRSIARHTNFECISWQQLMLVHCVIAPDPILSEALVAYNEEYSETNKSTRPIVLTKQMLLLLEEQRRRLFSRRLVVEIEAADGVDTAEWLEEIHFTVLYGLNLGLRRESHLQRFVELNHKMKQPLLDWIKLPEVKRTLEAGHNPARLLTELKYDLANHAEIHNE